MSSDKWEEESTAENTIKFELKVTCSKNPHAAKDATDPEELYKNSRGEAIACAVCWEFLCILVKTMVQVPANSSIDEAARCVFCHF